MDKVQIEEQDTSTIDYTTKYYLATHVCEACGGKLKYVNRWEGIRCPIHPDSGIIPQYVYTNIQRREAERILERNRNLLGRLEDDFEGFD